MRDLFKDFLILFGLGLWVLAIGLLLGILSIPVYLIETVACETKWTDRSSEFHFFAGCLVEHGGEMVPSDSIRFEGETR